METFSITIDDTVLKKLIAKLINRSAYFSVDPLPEGKYAISVKPENQEWIQKEVSKLKS